MSAEPVASGAGVEKKSISGQETYETLRKLAANAGDHGGSAGGRCPKLTNRNGMSTGGYAALRADPEAWAEYQEEIRLWVAR
jgi:hypothetical protein